MSVEGREDAQDGEVMDKRTCMYCGKAKDLRPYGRGGKDICFDCMVADPEREAEAKRMLFAQLNATGPLVLEPGVGPVPIKKAGDA